MDLKRYFRGPFVAVLVMLLLFFIVFAYANRGATYTATTTSRVVEDILQGRVQSATLIDKNQTIQIVTKDGKHLQANWVGNQGQQLAQELQKNPPSGGYNVQVPSGNTVIGVIFSFLPYILIILIFFFLINQMQGGGSRVMNFGKSKAKLITKDTPKTTFADVAGADEAIEELQEIKEFLQTPGKFQAIGAKIPKGVLLYGPPGTGKTLLARAVAGRRASRSTRSPALTSWRCSSVSARPGCATCSSRPRPTRPPSCSWMRSTRSAGTVAPGSAAGTTSGSKRSTSCW